MVLGIITSIAACPAIIGTTEAIHQGQRQNKREQARGQKSNLLVTCSDPCKKATDVNGGTIVLKDGKLYATTVNPKAKFSADTHPEADSERPNQFGHLFAGYFFPYPEKKWGKGGDGYVTTIADDPPQLNWVFVDKDTYEVRYGLRKDAEEHLVGPWTCTPIDRRLTFDGWEGFMVVETERDSGIWQLYFDVDDDGLDEKVPLDKRVMEIELTRKEMRMRKGDPIMLG
ncbi:hypothetical protein F5884DRAFT_853060 [Xylogone sp. PMI_703]|nr:hypothetical protein F5884DRAFT_853060 [Xylogone sp. PMI_703]